MEEIWKDVVGLEKWFEVSNKGRVRSKDRLVNSRWGSCIKKPVKGKILSQRKVYSITVIIAFIFQKTFLNLLTFPLSSAIIQIWVLFGNAV